MTEEELNAENIRRLKAFESLQESAMQLWQLYQSFLSVGFDEEQALALVFKFIEVTFHGVGN